MLQALRSFLEFVWLFIKGFRPVEFVRGQDRVSLHASGWRANGTGRMKTARDAVEYLDSCEVEQWRQIYCGMSPFLVSDRGNVRRIDGSDVPMTMANGRYQIMYKPTDARGRGKNGTVHKKRVYRSMLVAMAWLGFSKGDTEHEIHHINGYRTDDRLCNLMIVTHEEHMRIHQLGACGLTGLPDEALSKAPAAPSKEKESKPPTKKPAKAAESPSKSDAAKQEGAIPEKKANPSRRKKAPAENERENPAAPAKQDKGKANSADNKARTAKTADGKPRATEKKHAAAADRRETDWRSLREKLDRALDAYLESSRRLEDQKELNKAARPVYKALKPFLTCPDAIDGFDAALASVRTIASSHQDDPAAMSSTTHSMVGTMHQLMKDSTKRIVSEADEIELACLDELLDNEAKRPLFRKTTHAKKFRQCLSIARSRNEKKSVSPDRAAMD